MYVGKNTKKNGFECRNALIPRRPENGVFFRLRKRSIVNGPWQLHCGASMKNLPWFDIKTFNWALPVTNRPKGDATPRPFGVVFRHNCVRTGLHVGTNVNLTVTFVICQKSHHYLTGWEPKILGTIWKCVNPKSAAVCCLYQDQCGDPHARKFSGSSPDFLFHVPYLLIY